MPMTPDEHAKLARVDERTAAMQTTLNDLVGELRAYAATQTRHDEQIRTMQRAGGGLIAFVTAVLTALVKDRLHL
jgi:hypothetical protein